MQSECRAGCGTFVKGTSIYASLLGLKRVVTPSTNPKKPLIEIARTGTRPVVPSVGDIVTARVLSVTPRLASLDILCVGPAPSGQRYSGIIRLQDVRATEIDKVQLSACFRPGDIVKARVLSLGDFRSFYLTTAQNELGVVFARSLAGEPMIPISWQEMQCPKTKVVEMRKVAKV